jgi:hypothetical protein
MRTRRSRIAAIAAATTLLATLASTVSAAPVERTRSTIECLGSSVTLVMHPGWAASVLWDISTEDVPNSPSYIMKKVEGSVYVDGVLTSTFSTSIGEMTGFGAPLICAWEVHEPGRDVYGTSELVQL